jgi:hypothetical protein
MAYLRELIASSSKTSNWIHSASESSPDRLNVKVSKVLDLEWNIEGGGGIFWIGFFTIEQQGQSLVLPTLF